MRCGKSGGKISQSSSIAGELSLSRRNSGAFWPPFGGVMQMSGDCEECGVLLKYLDKPQKFVIKR